MFKAGMVEDIFGKAPSPFIVLVHTHTMETLVSSHIAQCLVGVVLLITLSSEVPRIRLLLVPISDALSMREHLSVTTGNASTH